MNCERCGRPMMGDKCPCGVKLKSDEVLAPWRSFECIECEYTYAFRSFEPITRPLRCHRCIAGNGLYSRRTDEHVPDLKGHDEHGALIGIGEDIKQALEGYTVHDHD